MCLLHVPTECAVTTDAVFCPLQADEGREAAEEQRILDEAATIVRRKKSKLEKLAAAAAKEISGDDEHADEQLHDEL
jgi:hypothetical protein